MSKAALMTGVTGYLGSHLAKALLKQGYSVVGLKRRTSSLHRVEALLSDIFLYDLEDLDYTVPFTDHGSVNIVIHTATCYGRNGESINQIAEANTVFPLRLLEAAIDAGTPAFLNVDTSLDKYLNAYALSKKQFAEWGRYFANAGRIRFLNARLEHFYGPGDDASKFTTHVMQSCQANVPELKLTAGEQKRDFIYIDDTVDALLTVLGKSDSLADRFTEFDVCSGQSVSVREFVETVHRLTNSTTKLNFGAVPYRDGEVMLAQADISKLKHLGWQPHHTLEQGLKLTMGA
ncbi:MAG TPA: NAD-dependent epimerase/dehydratase [Mariprofundaceae bacterium]|nr:NAD-dependent epimerase/dehydratase [Mariprofundaceae bacterium]